MRVFSLSIVCSLLVSSMLYGEVTIGADVVSRYVWRGSDYGNAAAVQPGIETTVGPVTFGAWGSWSISPGPADVSGNECDLYASTTVGPVDLTVTDYFFPAYTGDSTYTGDGIFKYSGDDATHTFELSASTDVGPVSLLAAAYVSGDTYLGSDDADIDRNSLYLEVGYGAFSVGLGNGDYTADDGYDEGSFGVVSIGVSASRDNFSASYIINPDQETSFLVFGVKF